MLVWDLKCVDTHIISADSSGRVTIWQDSFGTISQSFQDHYADVLALAVDHSSSTIYSTGVDQRIICYKKSGNKWIKDNEVKVHTGDVRCLDISSRGFLASGGVDSYLLVFDTNQFYDYCRYSQLQDSCQFFSFASGANVIMHQSNTSVQLWQFCDKVPLHLMEIKTKGTDYILSSSISSDATKVAISTVKNFWLYQLNLARLQFHCVLFLKFSAFRQKFCCSDSILIQAFVGGLRIYDIPTNQWRDCVKFTSHNIRDFICNDKGSSILIINAIREFFVFDLEKEEILYKFPQIDSYPLNFFELTGHEFILCCSNGIYSCNLFTSKLDKLCSLKDKKFKGCNFFQSNLLVYDDQSLFIYRCQNNSMKEFFSLESNIGSSTILCVSFLCTKTLLIIENSACDDICESSQIVVKEQYGT